MEVLDKEDEVDEEEEDDMEIYAEFRDEERSINYHCLFSFLPMMPFHRTLAHNYWDQLFWTFKAYPSIKVLAQRYPSILHFAQKMIMNKESFASYNKVLYIPKSFFENHSPSPHFYCFDELLRSFISAVLDPRNPFLVTESQNPMTDELNAPSAPVVESLNSATDDQISLPTPIVESPHPMIDSTIIECDDPTIEDQIDTSPIHSPVHTVQ